MVHKSVKYNVKQVGSKLLTCAVSFLIVNCNMNTTITYSNANPDIRYAPILYLNNVADAIIFYQQAFNATELRRWSNDDGYVHVAELEIGNALFRLHEETVRKMS